MKFLLLFLILTFATTISAASKPDVHLGKFSSGDLAGWKEQTVGFMKNKTIYSFSKSNDRTALVAHSTKSASALLHTLNLDPKEYPTIKWSWKIDHILKKGDEKTKEGDDFAVRIYVIFPRGIFTKTRAICYVWANKLPKGEHFVSPFTPNIVTVAVDSGAELAGRWTFHQRNVYEDYRSFFGEVVPFIGGVGIMTDTDNTGETAVGYYGDISIIRSSSKIDEAKPRPKESPEKAPIPKDPLTKEQPISIPPSTLPATPEHKVPPADPTTNGVKPQENALPLLPNHKQ
jgi:hypothetical protein